MEKFLLEEKSLKQAFLPVDLNVAPVSGERISLEKAHRVSIVLCMGDSTSATVQVSLQQHNAASGGDSKALEISNKNYKKVGAALSFTKVEPEVAASSFDISSDFANDEGIFVLEVLPEDLDVNNDFSHISVNVADSGAAKVASCLYVVHSEEKPAHVIEL